MFLEKGKLNYSGGEFEMMMVEAEEGSPAVEFCRAEKEENGDDFDIIDVDALLSILEEPSNPPQVLFYSCILCFIGEI